MLLIRRISALVGAALLTSGLAVAGPVLTTSANAAEVLVDGGFEAAAGDPPVSPGWTVTDTVGATPICTPAFCTATAPGVGPHDGVGYVLFGGSDDADHTSSISQTVTIPQGSASLTYWFANPEGSDVDEPAHLDITIDGQRVDTKLELEEDDVYEREQLDVSEFADGAGHVLAFQYENGDPGANSMIVDDISIDATAGPAVVNANPATLGAIPPGVGCNTYTYGQPRDVTFTVVGQVGRPTSVGVRIAFHPEHTYAGDVQAVLIAPDGRRQQIFGGLDDFTDEGASDDDNDLTGPYLFTDAASPVPSIEQASAQADEDNFDLGDDPAVPPGHYRAASAGGDLITPAFADLSNTNGTWTLRVRDLCDDDVGTVSAAALLLTTDGVPVDSDGDGVPDVTDDCPGKAGVKPLGCPDTKAPDTDFLNPPSKGISKSLKVPFGFVSDEAGVTYVCSLDGASFAACANPTTLTVKPGKHTFRTAARDAAGNVDPYPVASTFTAYDCASLNAKVKQLTKALTAVKKSIKKTEGLLEQAVEDGDQAAVKELEAKLTKLEKKKATTATKLAKAKKGAAPCKG